MKKLLLSTLFLLVGIVSVSAGSYNIWVCGQQVTDDNKSNIKGFDILFWWCPDPQWLRD